MATTVVTSVIFTDLVSSTETASRLGAVAAEVLRTTHFGLLRAAVAATGGTEVKNLGDGLMVVYASVHGALDGAVAMQQRIEAYNRTAAEPLGVRIGMSAGDTVEEDGDYFGEPVVEAARLCAKAQGGQIVTTEMVRMLARHADHRFTAIGMLELKGLPDPVAGYEVGWAPAGPTATVALPRRLATTPASGVVGRAFERARLAAVVKSAADGRRVVLLSGEPGIGKTTLCSDLARRAHDEGATVLYGRCDEDLGVPYQPFVEAIGGYLAEATDTQLKAIDARSLSELSRLVPQVRERVPGVPAPQSTDGEAERYLLFRAITGLLTDIAAAAPLVFVLDDLHWADKPTVLLLRHIVATLDQAAVVIVGTYRESELTATHPLTEGLASLWREPAVERMVLGGLDDLGVVAMLEGIAGHEMDSDGVELAHAVRRETEGNPFFTAEVLRHLAESGAIRQEDGRWVATVELSAVGLPVSVREVVGQRVRRLEPATQQILTTASVIGRDFDLGLLARLVERDEDAVLDALEEAAEAQVVVEVDGRPERFTFSHALLQHTLYDQLSTSRRARAHRRIAELLEIECGDDPGDRIGELAHHWVAATKPADTGKAAEYARRAGERAVGALAPDEAIRWFRQAIELLDAEPGADPGARVDLAIALGDAQRQAGDPEYQTTLLAAAAEATRLGDTGRLVAAALANERGAFSLSDVGPADSERITMLERALAAVGDDDSEARSLLLATLASALNFSGNFVRCAALAADAEAMARRLGGGAALLRVLNLTFLSLWVPDQCERTVRVSEEALELASAVRDPVARFWAAEDRFYAMASTANRTGMDEALDLATSLADELGQPSLTWWVQVGQCCRLALAGAADETERLATETLQLGTDTGQLDALTTFAAVLTAIRWHQGRLDEILPLIAQTAAENSQTPAFQAAYAMVLCECGLFDEVRSVFESARAADFYHSTYDYTWLTNATLWADIAAWLEDRPAAEILFERLAPFEPQGVTTVATFTGTVGTYLARLATVLDRLDDATELFTRADAQLRALGAPFWQARNQIEWARALTERGTGADLDRARALVSEATATAAEFGCAGLVDRANELDLRLAERSSS